MPLLSVCIPTYNRRERVCRLVATLLALDEDLEICVHVDGSTDGTLAELSGMSHRSDRITITFSENKGQAHALKRAILSSRGEYVVLYNDDDTILPEGWRAVIVCLRQGVRPGSCGFIFHMQDVHGRMIGGKFNRACSNFLQLRQDDRLSGDKKEVVKSELLKVRLYPDYHGVRRIPPSLLWTKLALDYDVEPIDIPVGVKDYLADGISKNLVKIKMRNPQPMFDLYRLVVRGFFRNRYRSPVAFSRAVAKAVLYGVYTFLVFWPGRSVVTFVSGRTNST